MEMCKELKKNVVVEHNKTFLLLYTYLLYKLMV